MLRILTGAALCFVYGASAHAQPQGASSSYTTLSLSDLSSFQPAAANWQIAGFVRSNREEESSFRLTEGAGILVNVPTETDRVNLFTAWDHGDIELDLDIMMPRGSNSGIYFQSRYEIQLFDSWGVDPPGPIDMGGIYERWDESRPEGQKGYEGHAPRVNVARAPGLWQHLNVVFQAPRFDGQGIKTSPARFVKVTLNGVVIHENVQLSGPTRAAAFEDSEAARAPLMIQGDHGPVAFRNIRYRKFDKQPVSLSNLAYSYYRGDFTNQMPLLEELTLVRSEPTNAITAELADTTKLFALRFEGNLDIPESGNYTFEVVHTARFALEVDGRLILDNRLGEDASGDIGFASRLIRTSLAAGAHDFTLTYAKGLWQDGPAVLGWYISGPGLLRTPLTAPGSVPANAFSAYEVRVEDEPLIQRNFVVHRGVKRTHAMSVGFPGGLHYAYDMGSGALLHLWKGSFVDTSTMWYQRGEMQSALPLGSLIERSGETAVFLQGQESNEAYRFLNYRLDASGRPIFTYKLDGLTVHDTMTPDAENKFFTREITIEGDSGSRQIWCLIAESEKIERLDDGSFVIDDQGMYIETDEDLDAQLVSKDGKVRLVAPVNLEAGQARISYRLVW